MRLNGGIRYSDNGLKTAIRGMQLESGIIHLTNQNVIGFDKVGYQRKEISVSSFAEYLGADALSTTVDDAPGRIQLTEKPLDFAIATKGYFQVQNKEGIKLTRDGRFKLDKLGNLLALDDSKVLANDGTPIKLSIVPDNLTEVVVNEKGQISVLNKDTKKLDKMATIGVVDANGALVMNPKVRQGYEEYSNVSLQHEFLNMMVPLRNFDANRQMFMIESSVLTKTISQLMSS